MILCLLVGWLIVVEFIVMVFSSKYYLPTTQKNVGDGHHTIANLLGYVSVFYVVLPS